MSKQVFLGSKALGLSILKAINIPVKSISALILCNDIQDDRSILPKFIDYASENEIPYFIVDGKKEASKALAHLAPDIVMVSGWYWLFDEETINLPKKGIWGIHNSLLPKYRGGAPLVWALINGEQSLGASLFRIGLGMDDGAVAHQFKIKIDQDSNIADVLIALEQIISLDIRKVWNALVEGTLVPYKQDHTQATFCGLRIAEDGQIDWSQTATEVHNFIRAQSPPYPCAFTYLDKDRVRVVRSRLCATAWQGTPGQVLVVKGDATLISCGQHTAIFVTRVLDETGNEIPASNIFRSIKMRLK